MRWDAIDWSDRTALMRMRNGGRPGADPHATVRQWLEWHGQTPRLIELLWEPLAVAALNQSIDEAAGAAVRRGARAHVHEKTQRTRRLGLVR